MSDGPESPSGRQHTITWAHLSATVTEVGAGLRCFEAAGEPVVWGYGVEEMSGAGRGQVLAPWPNRLEDGSYRFEGVEGTAALDEPDRRNAIHGLVRWLRFELQAESASESSVTLAGHLAAQPAYPWGLELRLTYDLTGAGLGVTVRAGNPSGRPAPFGAGFHPYIDAGPGGADGCSLALAAGERLVADDRGLPIGREAVGADSDFARGRPAALRGAVLDDCFTRLGLVESPPAPVPAEAAWSVAVVTGAGRGATVWGDAGWPYAMCFTGDTLGGEDRRPGVAVEPMTCPPNAFRSGESVIVLEPGEWWSGRFGIVPVGA